MKAKTTNSPENVAWEGLRGVFPLPLLLLMGTIGAIGGFVEDLTAKPYRHN